MKKLNKILAITSAVMFMSCVGGVSPRAVKYNEKGIPYALELPENPTEAQVFEELQIVENIICEKCEKFSIDQLWHNTFKFHSEIYYCHKDCPEELAKWLASKYIFKDLKTQIRCCEEAALDYSKITERFYQGVLDGEMGVCQVTSGYFYILLKNAGVECYCMDLNSNTGGHRFVVYKPNHCSKDWYVLHCGLPIEGVELKDLTLSKYLTAIRDFYLEPNVEIQVNLTPSKFVPHPVTNLTKASSLGYDLFIDTNLLMKFLIADHNKYFNLK